MIHNYIEWPEALEDYGMEDPHTRKDNAVMGGRFALAPTMRINVVNNPQIGMAIDESIGFMLDIRKVTHPMTTRKDMAGNELKWPGEWTETEVIPEGISMTKLAMTTGVGLEIYVGFSIRTNGDYIVPLGLEYHFQ
ncbi:MAG: hypothetical protein WC683_08845 [bacterium]